YGRPPGEGWFLVSLVLSPDGFGAWETQVSSSQAIFALDGQGTRQLDTESVSGSSSGVANLNITSDEVTWTHDGQPMSATLRH
ncbi:MAG TPA: hypothetical protein VKR21_13885, partial [Solirubrobacteraceae bacterium]|nr:hypothetical protein [Solirubrobacteraceae bacterium]